jgi:hypothetical protein
MIWSGAGPVSNVTIKDNQIRDSKRANLAVVVSGKTSGITLGPVITTPSHFGENAGESAC